MKQTAVEWLISKLQLFNITKEEHYEILCQIELEAKEMEKKDICHFGAKCCFMTTQKKSWTIEELYNEQFKNK